MWLHEGRWETPTERVERLERERDELENKLADARGAAKPKKTRGRAVAERIVVMGTNTIYPGNGWLRDDGGVCQSGHWRDDGYNSLSAIGFLAFTIDAEIATAKAEQREADAAALDAQGLCATATFVRNNK